MDVQVSLRCADLEPLGYTARSGTAVSYGRSGLVFFLKQTFLMSIQVYYSTNHEKSSFPHTSPSIFYHIFS